MTFVAYGTLQVLPLWKLWQKLLRSAAASVFFPLLLFPQNLISTSSPKQIIDCDISIIISTASVWIFILVASSLALYSTELTQLQTVVQRRDDAKHPQNHELLRTGAHVQQANVNPCWIKKTFTKFPVASQGNRLPTDFLQTSSLPAGAS
jgi:hypothetical protein